MSACVRRLSASYEGNAVQRTVFLGAAAADAPGPHARCKTRRHAENRFTAEEQRLQILSVLKEIAACRLSASFLPLALG